MGASKGETATRLPGLAGAKEAKGTLFEFSQAGIGGVSATLLRADLQLPWL